MMMMMMMSAKVIDQHTELEFCNLLAHWNNSPRVAMSLNSDKLFWHRATKLLSLSAVWPAEKQ